MKLGIVIYMFLYNSFKTLQFLDLQRFCIFLTNI